MKIGILTFHCAQNYGALMQTYGLQEYLKSKGHEVEVIDYRPEYLLALYRTFRWHWRHDLSVKQNLFFLLRDILVSPIRMKRKRGFTRFIAKHINLCPMDVTSRGTAFDAFVFGSDQIWNPRITNGFDDIYFGRFPAADGKLTVAYAASVGKVEHVEPDEQVFISRLTSFSVLSVREKSLADFIDKRMSGRHVEVVIDPVLLAGRSVFEKIASAEEAAKDYLLVFQLSYDDASLATRRIAKAIAEEKKLKVIELVSFRESIRNNRQLLTTAPPEQFITIFMNASYVVTTSYHGTVFSILFEKDFTVVDTANSERMVNLLSALSLEKRMASDEKDVVSGKIDYTKANKRLENLRAHSRFFLRDVLDKTSGCQQI